MEILTNQDVMNQYDDLEECILMGFSETSDDIFVLNYCIIYTKYYIFIQRLFNKYELDLLYAKQKVLLTLNIELSICKKRNEHHKFIKFSHIYEKL